MRALLINSVCGVGSTGRICIELADRLAQEGYECMIAYGRTDLVPEGFRHGAKLIGNSFDVRIHGVLSRLFDNQGLHSKAVTRDFLKWCEEYNPDLLWLHNLHGYYINYELLFAWIKSRPQMQVKWSLHDCWAFTGHCSYFSMVGCDKWTTHCSRCPQKHRYPESILFDNSRKNFDRKKRAFCGAPNMTLVTPSQWLADLVKMSFLSEYTVEVQHNKIDSNKFKPVESDFRRKHGIENMFVILGVTAGWGDRKGLFDFLKLSQRIDDQCRIVLVGLNDEQIQAMPDNIIGMKKTNDVKELAEIYSMADVFINASKEETFGLTTLEATYCGTPAIVYKGTACEEVVNTYGGIAVDQGEENLYHAIMSLRQDQLKA